MRIMGYDSHRYCQIAMLDTDTGELARLPEIEKLSLECTGIKNGGSLRAPQLRSNLRIKNRTSQRSESDVGPDRWMGYRQWPVQNSGLARC
jgi:hypothetical protein